MPTVNRLVSKIRVIRSGGQTGVDRAAFDAARRLEIPIAGWCPKGGLAEDCPDPPGLLELFPEMAETPKGDYYERTEWNVRDSDATLVFFPREMDTSAGTEYTIELAEEMQRPHLVLDRADAATAIAWLDSLGDDLDLNVAGPRERNYPGIHDVAQELLVEVLEHYRQG